MQALGRSVVVPGRVLDINDIPSVNIVNEKSNVSIPKLGVSKTCCNA